MACHHRPGAGLSGPMDYDDIYVGNPKYQFYLSEDIFHNVAREMMACTSKKFNARSLELLRQALRKKRNPTLDDVFTGCEYTTKTVANRKTDFRATVYFDADGTLNDLFHREYFRRAEMVAELQVEAKDVLLDAALTDEAYVNQYFSFQDVLSILRKNRKIQFKFPDIEPDCVDDLDHLEPTVQYVELSHISTGVKHPFHVDFFYKCPACAKVIRSPNMLKNNKCTGHDCDGKMVRDQTRDMVVDTYVSQVLYKNNPLPVISLVPLPDGEFKTAMIMCRDNKNTKYFGFILAIKRREYEESALELPRKNHAVWELVDAIDRLHEERLGTMIRGLDYPKAAFLMAAIANFSKYPSENILFAGRAGTGKTIVPFLYIHTLSLHGKVQESSGTSVPGMVGSSITIDVNGQRVMVQEPGLMAKHEFVLVDELYDQKEQFLKNLKTNLLAMELNKNMAGVKINALKKATVFATANIDTSMNTKYQARFDELLRIYLANPQEYAGTSRYAERAIASLPGCMDPGIIIRETIKHEYFAWGKNWVDGRDLPDVDRFSLIFYMGSYDVDPGDKEFTMDDMSNVDYYKPSGLMHELIYSQEIRDYIQMCAMIKVKVTEKDMQKACDMANRIYYRDFIHSESRFINTLKRMLNYSAQFNCRDYLTQEDFDFVEELLLHTCNWFEPEDLVRTHKIRFTHRNEFYQRKGKPGAGSPVSSVVNQWVEEEGMAGAVYDPAQDMPERVSAIMDFVAEKYEFFEMGTLTGANLERAIGVITEVLMLEYDVAQRFMAKKFVLDYIKYREDLAAAERGNVFDDVEVIKVPKPEKKVPFSTLDENLSQRDIHDILVDEFIRCREIKKEDLSRFAEMNNIDVETVEEHIAHMKRKGLLIDVGDGYRLTA